MNDKAKVAPEAEEAETTTKVLTRDQMRAVLLGDPAKPESEDIEIFGIKVEFRQPTFGAMMDARTIADDKTRTVEMIVAYAFVPGTNERVFEDTDRDTILSWPFSSDIVEIQRVIARLTGVDIEAIEEELAKDPLAKR